DLLLEISDPLARIRRVRLGARGRFTQLLDIRDEIAGDRLDALVELNYLVRGRADLHQRVFVAQDQVLRRAIVLAHRADYPREVDRVPRLVVSLLREAARKVGVVAVLVQRPLGLREEGTRALDGRALETAQ